MQSQHMAGALVPQLPRRGTGSRARDEGGNLSQRYAPTCSIWSNTLPPNTTIEDVIHHHKYCLGGDALLLLDGRGWTAHQIAQELQRVAGLSDTIRDTIGAKLRQRKSKAERGVSTSAPLIFTGNQQASISASAAPMPSVNPTVAPRGRFPSLGSKTIKSPCVK